MGVSVAAAAGWGALIVLIAPVLAARIIRLRFSKRVGIGDGGDPELTRAVRVHGNYSEYAGLALGLLALMAGVGASVYLVHLVGGLFVLARLAHAYGLTASAGSSPARAGGTIGTLVALIVGAVTLLVKAL